VCSFSAKTWFSCSKTRFFSVSCSYIKRDDVEQQVNKGKVLLGFFYSFTGELLELRELLLSELGKVNDRTQNLAKPLSSGLGNILHVKVSDSHCVHEFEATNG